MGEPKQKIMTKHMIDLKTQIVFLNVGFE